MTYSGGVGVILNTENGYTLIVEEIDNLGKWKPVTGTMEQYELPQETLSRELYEEVGIVLPSSQFKWIGRIKVTRHSFFILYECLIPEPVQLKLQPEEINNAYWVKVNELIHFKIDHDFTKDYNLSEDIIISQNFDF